MALKAVLDSIEGLNELVKKEYKQGEDGKFHLDIEGVEDHPNVGALKRAKDREAEDRKKATTQLTEVQKQLNALTEERDNILKGAIPKADVDKLEGSYKKKLSDIEASYKGQVEEAHKSLHTLLVSNVAQKIAGEISKSPELLMPHVIGRLKAEIVDGKPFTRVLDKDGSLSAASIEDLKKELIANPSFAPIIIGSKASGSSAPKGDKNSSAVQVDKTKSLATMSPAELAATLAQKKQNQ